MKRTIHDPNTRKMTVGGIVIVLIILLTSGCTDIISVRQKEQHIEIPQYADKVTLTVYTTPGCDFCIQVEAWCEELKREYGDRILIRYVDVTTEGGWDEFKKARLNITPSVVINGDTLQFNEITRENLRESIRTAMGVF
ncbi:MAG: hypothetical protein HXS52_04700 [Theionarchaea archaeon]|nr:hypothetical protein [Theionarchaea archaeon]MBU7037205.1 hypothetical protein [Theionarchaea archaeon]